MSAPADPSRCPEHLAISAQGIVLLEVVLAITLFVLGAGVVVGAMTTSIRAERQVRLESKAADLAVTLLSEIQSGQVPAVSDGPNEYKQEDLEGWTWQVQVQQVETSNEAAAPMNRLTVIVSYPQAPVLYRLTQLILTPQDQPDESAGQSTSRPGGAL